MKTLAAAALLASALVAACAQAPARHEAEITPGGIAPVVQQTPPRRWWRACFPMPFDADGRPRWSVDLLLADRVAGPAVVRHAADIPLWRFHRRAAADAAGHRFSVLLYTDARTAAQVASEIRDNPVVAQLIDAGLLRRADTRCGGADQTAIGATSDARWDVRLQRAWPYFIMGVSAHWLALIGEVGADVPAAGDDTEQLLARYARIGAEIDRLWAAQGQHAYLHHLQALFGYEPLPVLLPLRF